MTRLHELDALRSVAMLLGIALHAALLFIPGAWPVQDAWAYSTSPEANPYSYLVSAIHGFRMPIFFLLSGFFTAMLWQRRGLRQLAMHRLRRIGLPLLLGAATIVPLNLWLFNLDDLSRLTGSAAWEAGFHHLWFLWLLLWLAAGFGVAARLEIQFRHSLWWLAIPVTLLPQMLMQEGDFGPDTSTGVLPDPIVLAYYALFFAFGAFLYQRNIVPSRWWAAALPPTLTAVFLAGLILLYEIPGVWAWAAAGVLQVAYAWLMCFGMIGLFRLIAARERAWVRYLSDASYWLYLWHLPLVIAAQRLLANQPFSPHLKFILLCVAVTAVLLVVYQLGVRYTPIGTMLNGKRTRTPATTPAASRTPA